MELIKLFNEDPSLIKVIHIALNIDLGKINI